MSATVNTHTHTQLGRTLAALRVAARTLLGVHEH
jgi:hypothetical protein